MNLIKRAKEMQEPGVLPDDVECVVSIGEDDEDKHTHECYYYLVHPKNRTLFWLNRFDAGEYMIDIPGVNEPSHISEHRMNVHLAPPLITTF